MRKNHVCWLLIFFLVMGTGISVSTVYPGGYPADVEIAKGEIKGAKFMIAVPQQWNKRLLIIAHGYRPVSAPLFADFPLEKLAYSRLLANSWMIACTSYRSNGLVYKEGVNDILDLRQYIEKKYGKPNQTFIQGISMGAVIATLIAENHAENFSGILGIAFPLVHENKYYTLTYRPKIPILFFSNQNEIADPRSYAGKVKPGKTSIPPVVWYVSRDGHVNISDTEEDTALKGLITLVATGKIEKDKDITLPAPVLKSSALFKDGGAYGTVKYIHPAYGNMDIDILEKDLKKLGIQKSTSFKLIFKDKQLNVFWGNAYADVPQGEWIAFVTANGTLEVARNFENAAKTLGCKIGDKILIKKLFIDIFLCLCYTY
ncbi:MAG: SAM-dependent chlorinase/fluorinase [Candidatus Aminicenantes bacterium]|nr:MAG: SAM-dependent chlorinase/fluorinase [Candidatus Aminicenantes bacterium]